MELGGVRVTVVGADAHVTDAADVGFLHHYQPLSTDEQTSVLSAIYIWR
jgi:hypothetical protein